MAALLAVALVATGAPRLEQHAHAHDDHGHDHHGLLAVVTGGAHDHDPDSADTALHVHVACSCPCALPLPPPQWLANPIQPEWMNRVVAIAFQGRINPPPYRPPIG